MRADIAAIWEFQFHKGAIKTRREVVTVGHVTEFQFHKGAIKTFKRGDNGSTEFRFNSIKVRLRHFGQLLATSASCFNSIKVRLRLALPVTPSVFLQFQFHKGAIKT